MVFTLVVFLMLSFYGMYRQNLYISDLEAQLYYSEQFNKLILENPQGLED